MPVIDVALRERSYAVHIGSGLLGNPGAWSDSLADAPVVIVTNDRVGPLYLDRLRRTLAGFDLRQVVLPDGESHKTVATWSGLMDTLLQEGLGRDACLVALGGGVIGDVCGFAAATYMRGVRCVQAPTTLLAQVDAAVGGKTGVNHPRGKNLIGAFHQPHAVIADIDCLSTLPAREYRAGLAEVVKYGAIRDANMLAEIEARPQALIDRETAVLERQVAASVRHKAEVVARDELEAGERALLNFGHTFGHALEAMTGYRRFLHGEAVAIGMVVAATLSEARRLCRAGAAERLSRLLEALGLPVRIPGDIDTGAMMAHMQLDKKNVAGERRLVLLEAVGRAVVDAGSTGAQVAAAIDACR